MRDRDMEVDGLLNRLAKAETQTMRQNIDLSARIAELERRVRDLRYLVALLATFLVVLYWRLWHLVS